MLPLRPKSFDVLVYLVQHPGRLVPKAELIDNVWQNVNVTENSLVQCIKDIRQALHDDTQTMIETVSKRGYLFASGGRDRRQSDSASAFRALAADADGSRAAAARSSLHCGAAVRQYERRSRSGVLRRRHFRGPDHRLSRIRWLFVIARNSTFVYKHRAVDVRQVARELGVRYVLEGSVRRAGKRLRISAQLIDALTGAITGPNNTTANSATSLPCRMKSPAASSARSNRACWPRRAFARCRVRSDDLGAWELVARAQTHVWRAHARRITRAAIDALKRPVDAYPDYAPARSLLGVSVWCFPPIMGWVDRDQGCTPAASTPFARSRSTIAIPGGRSRSAIWR